jgi:hypothetical protein
MSRAVTIEHLETMVVHECPSCFVLHAIPQRMHRERLADGGGVYCPNGHVWIFTESETARLKRQLEDAERGRERARAAMTAARDQAQAAERSAAAYKGQATRLRNRVGHGVCPCCNRSFANLGRHMAGQHPGFAEGDG